MQTTQKSIITILIILVLGVIGYVVYRSQTDTSVVTNPNGYSTPNNTYNTPSATYQTPAIVPKPADINMPEIFAQLKNISSATPAERDAFQKKLSSLAVTSSTLDLTNCKPNPPIMNAKMKVPFTVKNTGSKEVQFIRSNPPFSVTVPASSEKSVTLDLTTGGGIYGYNCGNDLVGILLVSQ